MWPAPYSVYWSSINDRAQDPFQCLETARVSRDMRSELRHLEDVEIFHPLFHQRTTVPDSWITPGQGLLWVPQRGTQWEGLSEATPLFSVRRVWEHLPMFLTKIGKSHSQQSCSVLTHSNSALHPKENAHPGESQRAPPPSSHQHNNGPEFPRSF